MNNSGAASHRTPRCFVYFGLVAGRYEHGRRVDSAPRSAQVSRCRNVIAACCGISQPHAFWRVRNTFT